MQVPPVFPDGRPYFQGFDPAAVPSPCFVVDRTAVEWNLRILRDTAHRAGAKVLLALKAFALPAVFPMVRTYLDGVCASGVYEARLGRHEIAPLPGDGSGDSADDAGNAGSAGKSANRPFEVHTFAPAYSTADLTELLTLSDHLIFNSLEQWHRLRPLCIGSGTKFGLRINPEVSTGDVPLYDPCAPGSRLGITAGELKRQAAAHADGLAGGDPLAGLSELHFHTLCEADSHALEQTLAAVEERFGEILQRPEMERLNIGGGHHITRSDYDRDHLVSLIRDIQGRYNVEVVMEPGEAAAIHSGVLVSTVLDLPRNDLDLAIMDTSATAHMPDTLEMPYRAEIWGARDGAPHRYRLGGQTCLAGDVMGDYSFTEPLRIGDRLVFDDMSHYTMVKTTTFNGIALPAIALWDSRDHTLQILRYPAYADYRGTLG